MEFYGIKINSDLIASSPLFLKILLFILLLAMIRIIFGSLIEKIGLFIWKKFKYRSKTKKVKEWIAICITREGWKQKADGYPLELENRHLQKLTFDIMPIGSPKKWRGGFIIGNEKYHPQSIVDPNNSLLFHVGSPPTIANGQYVWYYNQDQPEGNPGSTTVTKNKNTKIHFEIIIDRFHWLKVLVNKQQIYNAKIPRLFRNKVYLLAWGDEISCKVKFTNIVYSI